MNHTSTRRALLAAALALAAPLASAQDSHGLHLGHEIMLDP